MTLTTLITVNAALGAAVAYGLHHLLAHSILSDRDPVQQLVSLPEQEAERIAA